jgi:hypothetical protein
MSEIQLENDTTPHDERRAKYRNDMRNKRRNASRKKVRDQNREENLPFKNLERYRKMSIDRRFEFAIAGYRFPNNPDVPAIELCTTRLNCPEGMQRGIKVGKALPYLPPNFVILYSKTGITDLPQEGIQMHYQLQLAGGRYMQIHTEPTTAWGLANFINAPARRRSIVRPPADGEVEQNLKVAQCTLTHSTSRYLSDHYKNEYPIYVNVDYAVPQDHELLVTYGPGHRLP